MKEVITACVLYIISAGLFVLSFRSFREKGFLFNNAYIYASKEERECMDKKPYYRQSAVVLLLLGVLFLLNGTEVFLGIDWLFGLVIITAVITIVYAIISSIRIGKS